MTTVRAFLGAGDGGTFVMGDGLYGAFGGVFGGAVAAATVLSARDAAPAREDLAASYT